MSLLAFLFFFWGQFGKAPNIPPVRSASSAVCEPGLHGIILFSFIRMNILPQTSGSRP